MNSACVELFVVLRTLCVNWWMYGDITRADGFVPPRSLSTAASQPLVEGLALFADDYPEQQP